MTNKTFFTSDLHFFHNNIIGYCNRPYTSVEQMNRALVDNWNSVVDYTDTVWVLGDVSFGRPDETAHLLRQLKGTKYLVMGNHDRKGKCEKLKWLDHFTGVYDYVRLKVDDMRFVLCHFPFRSWERGYVNLHGHMHSSPDKPYSGWKQYDVGVDNNNHTPVLAQDAFNKSTAGKTKPEVFY